MRCKNAGFVGIVLAAVVASLTPSPAARACTCAEQPARVLLPLPGAAHVAGAPIVVVGSRPSATRLYDPQGNPVELPLVRQWVSLGACGSRYFVYQPSAGSLSTPGAFELRLGPEGAPLVRQAFSVEPPEGHGNITRTVEVRVSYSPSEPYVASQEMCDAPQLEDRPIDGSVEYTVTLSAPAPVFTEAWYTVPSLGVVRDQSSTFALDGESNDGQPQTVARIELPHLQGADDCIEVRLYAWNFEPLLSDRVCFMSEHTQTESTQLELPQWPHGRANPASAGTEHSPRSLVLGCNVSPSVPNWSVLLGSLVGLSWLRRRRANDAQ
ncbi:MAG: hypothetical protein QM784_22165 [Polyangiaceae bacterium]